MSEPIVFTADKVKINAPLVDGGGSITFYFGEYALDKVLDVLRIPQQTTLKVTVEVANE
jgi:hypothetical protein